MCMNSQNILNFNGNQIDVRIDFSENYDLELSNCGYDERLLSSNPIDYSGISTTMDFSNSSVITTITLTNNNLRYVIPYIDLIQHMGGTYEYTFLTTDTYKYSDGGEEVILWIDGFNETLPSLLNDFYFTNLDNIPIRDKVNFELRNFNIKPWVQQIKKEKKFLYPIRNSRGWTMEFKFRRGYGPWFENDKFFYMGVRGDSVIEDYADNSLSFGFTNQGEFIWTSAHLKSFCLDQFVVDTGKTNPLFVPFNEDFVVTIVFDRYIYLYDCDIPNEGGVNDYIVDYATLIEELSFKWDKRRIFRLGDLKVYVNGRLNKTFRNFEETILSDRGEQPYIMSWGGGTGLMNDIHLGSSKTELRSVRYFTEPLQPLYVKHNYFNYYK